MFIGNFYFYYSIKSNSWKILLVTALIVITDIINMHLLRYLAHEETVCQIGGLTF